jgi:hypothetical protein
MRLFAAACAIVTVTITSGAEAKTNHWSFQPVVRPTLPRVPRGAVRNDIDRFILARLAKEGLGISLEADKRTLMRRVYFDLIGLPPSPEEVHEFATSKDPSAYEKLVDRLLNSPRYGERWARHWLDVVRFAESHGFEMNQARPNAWPYRDYVIRAFNEDKPYDRFIVEQLAGDALGIEEGTGFLVGGPWDQVKSPDPALTANQRADELHDMVSTVGSTFLALTVGCARCHNHKFDPIPQTDYYAIKASLEGVQHGERPLKTRDTGERMRELAKRTHELREIEARMDELEPLATAEGSTNRLRVAVSPRRNVERFTPVSARRVRFTVNATTDVEPCIDELEVYTSGANSTNVALAAHGTKAAASSVFPNSDIHRLEHINDGKHGNSRSWISNERGQGWVELEFPAVMRIERIVWGRDLEQKYADRLAVDYRIEAAVTTNDWSLIASSADRRPYKKETESVDSSVDGSPEQRELATRRKALEKRVRELSIVPSVYAGRFETPKPTMRFHRGDPMQPREEVQPAALSRIAIQAQQTSFPVNESDRRLALANWIVSPGNPLTARVMVNRLWHHHFGRGLVETPSDFGLNGARPTHPELLDWLAGEFVARHWSIKEMQRLIVTSATYRQSSASHERGKAIDGDARLLWRYPPRRLEAETIRDAMLAVSGKLNLKMGGPGFDLFEPNSNYVKVYNSRADFGPEEWRRMVYQAKPRMQLENTFGAFDCPDAGQIAPRRTSSTTPLQALNLLNSAFVLQQAEFFAERVQREANVHSPTTRAFELAFNRRPAHDEARAAEKLVQEHGLPVLCRALFNASEFIYTQ